MKQVTHVITTIERGGAEKQLLTLARLQKNTGREVTVIPLKGTLDLLQEFEESGVNVNTDLMGRGFFFQIRILRQFFKNNVSIIHAHLPRAELIASIAKSNQALVISRHNAEPFFPGAPRWFSRTLSRFVTSRSRKGIAISDAVLNYLIQEREISRKFSLSTIYYGYEPSFSQESARVDFGFSSGPVLGTIGRLVPQKDYDTLLHAFKLTLADFSTANLIILGDGYLLPRLQELAKNLGILDRVHFLGKKPNVLQYLDSLDLFVLASKYEGFGLVLLEAMSCNVPIVASNNSAIPEVLGINHPGLAQTGNPEDFHNKFVSLLGFEGRREALRAQRLSLDLFSPEKMLESMEKFYSGL